VRIRALGLLVGFVAFTLTASALASPQFAATFEMAYFPEKAASSGGINTRMTWSDPGEPAGRPKRVTKIKFLFHPGTRIDTSALRRCPASDDAVLSQGAAACPRGSRLGSATSQLLKGTGPPALTTQINFFNARREIIVLVMAAGRPIAVYRDDVRGRTVTVNLGLPSSFALLELRANIQPHVKGRGKRRRVYFRTPPVCPPSNEWTTTVTFTYADGSTQQLSDGTPCRRR
jgi:hypothetical protein